MPPMTASDIKEYLSTQIIQGPYGGDCYFLAAVAASAENPRRITRLFNSCSINKNGIYMARLMVEGKWKEVVVDDQFPAFRGEPLYAKPFKGRAIWVMVLEKCWAKVNGGYKRIDCISYIIQTDITKNR